MDSRRVVWAVACLFLLAAVAMPASAEKPDGTGGKGNGNGGEGKGNGKGGGNAGGTSDGNAGGRGSSGDAGGNQGSQGNEAGQSASSGQGADPSASSDSNSDAPSGPNDSEGSAGQTNGRPDGDAPGKSGDSQGHPASQSSQEGPQGPPSDSTPSEEAPRAPFIDETATATEDGTSGDSSSNGGGGLFGFLQDDAESGGSLLHAVKDRSDMSELLGTDMDSPVVSGGMVLLTIGTLAGIFGAVRSGTLHRPRPDARAQEEAKRHEGSAVAAGLPKEKWGGLEAASYVRLRKMDPHTVAFWMGAELAAVRRWQAGRTLDQDIQDGIMVPHRQPDEQWSLRKTVKSRLVLPDAESSAAHGVVDEI